LALALDRVEQREGAIDGEWLSSSEHQQLGDEAV
jgi:hypothetical protein